MEDGELFLEFVDKCHSRGSCNEDTVSILNAANISTLSQRKKRTLRELRGYAGGRLFDKLSELAAWKGLFLGKNFIFSYINRALSMRCVEEILSYLNAMIRMWTLFLGTENANNLDAATVNALHVLMPAHSTQDAGNIGRLFENGTLFSAVKGENSRKDIEKRVLDCKRILTLASFGADLIYLEACSRPLRDLFPTTTKQSIREAARSSYESDEQQFLSDYEATWLEVMRNFPDLSDHVDANTKVDSAKMGFAPRPRSVEQEKLLARFAKRHRFRVSYTPDSSVEDLNPSLLTPVPRFLELSSSVGDVKLGLRCGRPCSASFQHDRGFLTPETVFQSHTSNETRYKYPTSFAVVRSMVCAFFDRPERTEIDRAVWTGIPQVYPTAARSSVELVRSPIAATDQGEILAGSNAVHMMQALRAESRPASSCYSTQGASPNLVTARAQTNGNTYSIYGRDEVGTPYIDSIIESYYHDGRSETLTQRRRSRIPVRSTARKSTRSDVNHSDASIISRRVEPDAGTPRSKRKQLYIGSSLRSQEPYEDQQTQGALDHVSVAATPSPHGNQALGKRQRATSSTALVSNPFVESHQYERRPETNINVVLNIIHKDEHLFRNDRIYVASITYIEELTKNYDPMHKNLYLWSWSRKDKKSFESCISSLLQSGRYSHQLVSSRNASVKHLQQKVPFQDCWRLLSNEYLLVVLVPSQQK